ncbi:hypothetical protein CBL_01899 [Carabus blaptoides fortunei]
MDSTGCVRHCWTTSPPGTLVLVLAAAASERLQERVSRFCCPVGRRGRRILIHPRGVHATF